MREHTVAGIAIEQATVAMRCNVANSPDLEPRSRVVPESNTSALRAADRQLYNRTSLTVLDTMKDNSLQKNYLTRISERGIKEEHGERQEERRERERMTRS